MCDLSFGGEDELEAADLPTVPATSTGGRHARSALRCRPQVDTCFVAIGQCEMIIGALQTSLNRLLGEGTVGRSSTRLRVTLRILPQ